VAQQHKITAIGFAVCLIAANAQAAEAPAVLDDLSRWLAPGSDLAANLTTQPREILRIEQAGGRPPFLVRFGRLLFRSPLILGERAAQLGLSCDTCHGGGHVNNRLFVAGLSDRPGNIDGAHRFFSAVADDGRLKPINIPSLRGIRWRAPYGHDGRFWSLAQFTRSVIEIEFAGPKPSPVMVDALVAYQIELDHADRPPLSDAGRRGADLFQRDCAGCHIPSAGYLDRLSHDVGTGDRLDTPTLFGLSDTAPYFHDGSKPDLVAVVDYFDSLFGLDYDAAEQHDMLAFLNDVGGQLNPRSEIALATDLKRIADFVDLISVPLNAEDPGLSEQIIDLTRFELGRVYDRFSPPPLAQERLILITWSRRLADIATVAAAENFAKATADLGRWRKNFVTERRQLLAAESASLYDRSALRHAIENASQ
jgi:hypothetical protein